MTGEGDGITIGIVAGEASGDALAAELIGAVRARVPAARFAGIAGPQMISAGCEAWYPMSMLSLRGYVEVASRVPALIATRVNSLHQPRYYSERRVGDSRTGLELSLRLFMILDSCCSLTRSLICGQCIQKVSALRSSAKVQAKGASANSA